MASSVPALYTYTENLSDAIPGAGRVKRPTFFTNDGLHFVVDQDVQEGDIVINVSKLPTGENVPLLYGDCHRLLGQPQGVPTSGGRRANFRGFQTQSIEKPPTGVGL